MIRNVVKVLNDGEVERLHNESMQVLERVGLRVPHPRVLELCRKAGAVVDDSLQKVTIPAHVLSDLIETSRPADAPLEEPARELSGGISTQVFIVDYPGTKRRRGTLDDVRRGIRVSDTLKNIRDSSAIVIPDDIPYNETDIASYHEIYTYSNKPGGTYVLTPTGAKGIIEMARALGRQTGFGLDTISPLAFTRSALEIALVFADEKMPIGAGAMVVGGATGPVTIWGNCVLENAETLGSSFIVYAMSGRLLGRSSWGNHTMDLRTTLCSFGSPNQALLGMVAAQMARYYRWSGRSNSALSDACLPDYQCGFEKAFNGLFALLAGNSGIGGQGIVGADQGVSLEQLVLDNEWIDAYNYVLKGVEPDSGSLELIENVGIGGNFLSEEHTISNMRHNYWESPSKTFWRDQWEPWKDRGMRDIYARAHDYVELVSAGYRNAEPVLEPSKAEIIDEIYQDTRKMLAKERS